MTNPIVGIGELLWDVYPDGRKVSGGAPFNFAFHCHRLGHPAAIVSRVGGDDLGHELREEVRRLGLSDEFIQTDPAHPTGTVNVTLDAAGVPTYTIAQNVAWDYIEWTGPLADLVGRAAAVCFGTLAQRSRRSRGTIETAVAAAGNLKVFDVNIRGELTPQLYRRILDTLGRVGWVKMNDDELARMTAGPGGVPMVGGGRAWSAQALSPVFDTTAGPGRVAILTRGHSGPVVSDGRCSYPMGPTPANVVDTVGAGDSFTAAMVCLHLEGRSLRDCARFASHYAARVCEHPGATPLIDRAEVERAAFGT